ncbi:MAG: exodeoxyribonuclease III [Silvanigrellales bacterium]|jgi:exodeoxyribonuclease-3|nr:exodeoxyribonuclease III [Silvanigrellales bacterium]
MKLLSWNVNGIRSVSRYGFVDTLEKANADVVLLQEVRAEPEQWPEDARLALANHFGYTLRTSPAVKKGYSGTALLFRDSFFSSRGGVALSPETLADEVATAEGRFCGVRVGERCVVASVYFPNSQREGVRLPVKLSFCNAVLAQCRAWRARGLHVILGGDFNIAHTADDLANPKTNTKNAGFLPDERAWMTQFLEAGHLDTFRLFTKGNGHYTWWSNRPGVREKNVGWRIDAFVVDEGLRPFVRDASILAEVMGSDHCPVALTLAPEAFLSSTS